jgi:hypothetical protein
MEVNPRGRCKLTAHESTTRKASSEMLRKRLVEMIEAEPGLRLSTIVDEGRLPHTYLTIKAALIDLQSDGVIYSRRPAWVHLSAKGWLWRHGHPCKNTCQESGQVTDLREGFCTFCGKADLLSYLSESEQEVFSQAVVLAPMLQTVFLSDKSLSHLTVTKRKEALINLRKQGWLLPWTGLVKRPQ